MKIAREWVRVPGVIRGIAELHRDSDSESRRLSFLALCLLVMVPAAMAFTLFDWIRGFEAGALRSGVVATVFSLLLLAVLRRLPLVWPFLRVCLLLALGMIFLEASIGGGGGRLSFLWLFLLPLVVYPIFGVKEGLLWVGGTLLALGLLFYGGVGAPSYSAWLELRFLQSYLLLSGFASQIEASRRRNFAALEQEAEALESALHKIHELQDFLRICSGCRKIRDSEGFWNRIDAYVSHRSAMEFRDALCPECSSGDESSP